MSFAALYRILRSKMLSKGFARLSVALTLAAALSAQAQQCNPGSYSSSGQSPCNVVSFRPVLRDFAMSYTSRPHSALLGLTKAVRMVSVSPLISLTRIHRPWCHELRGSRCWLLRCWTWRCCGDPLPLWVL